MPVALVCEVFSISNVSPAKPCTRRSHLDSPILGGGSLNEPHGVRFGGSEGWEKVLEGVLEGD